MEIRVAYNDETKFDFDSLNVLAGWVGVDVVRNKEADNGVVQVVQGDLVVEGFVQCCQFLCSLNEVGAQLFPTVEVDAEMNGIILQRLAYRSDTLVPALINGQPRNLMPQVSRLGKELDFLVYLEDNKLSVSDVVIAPNFFYWLQATNEKLLLKQENILRWYDNIQHNPNFTVDELRFDIAQDVPKPPPPAPKQKKKNNKNKNKNQKKE